VGRWEGSGVSKRSRVRSIFPQFPETRAHVGQQLYQTSLAGCGSGGLKFWVAVLWRKEGLEIGEVAFAPTAGIRRPT